jgi:hypothetical protein
MNLTIRLSTLLFISLFLFSSCDVKDADLAEAIQRYYQKQSLAAGGGTYEISEVKILEKQKMPDGTYKVKAYVKGEHVNHSQPENQEPSPIEYQPTFLIERNKAGYEVTAER